MNIQIDHNFVQTKHQTDEIGMTPAKQVTIPHKEKENLYGVMRTSEQGFLKDNTTYNGQGKTTEDIQAEFGAKDVAVMQDYMTVMSNTLSGEDYQKLSEDGFEVGKMPVGETVTVLDEIKAKMAQAGVVIAGYNDDLDTAKLAEITGSEAYAQAIASAFQTYQVEPTESNILDTVKEISVMQDVQSISEDAIKYLVGNDLPLTFDQIYKAIYSSNAQAGRPAEAKIELGEMQTQIDKIIESAGLIVSEDTRKSAELLLTGDIPLTEKNLLKLDALKQMELPLSVKDIAEASARAICEGKRPAQANATEPLTLYEKAAELYERTQNITEEQVKAVAAGAESNTTNLKRLSQMPAISEEGITLSIEQEAKLITARRQLEEVRLQMTISANYQLMKKGIQLDIMPLKEVVEALKQQEQETASKLFPEKEAAKAVEAYRSWQTVTDVFESLPQMPARVLAQVSQETTFSQIHEQGQTFAKQYEAAQERYETIGTQVRTDLGDSIRKAFQNVDEVLKNAGVAVSEENERAVRILAYNHMDVTAEEIARVKEADLTVRGLLEQMTPAKTLQMLRDGINPLQTDMKALQDYFANQGSELDALTNDVEQYGKFIYHLEQSGQMTSEEKEALIGVYRLIHQIEKADGAAIGAVTLSGADLNFDNLLKAARTRKGGRFEKAVDDMQQSVSTGISNSISKQIETYFDQYSQKQNEQAYAEEAYRILKEATGVPAEVLDELMLRQAEITPDVLLSQRQLSDAKENLYARMKKYDQDEKLKKAGEKFVESLDAVEDAQKAFEEIKEVATEVVEDVLSQGEATYLDIRSMVSSCKQLSLASSYAKDESYIVPLEIGGELAAVSVQILHQSEQTGTVEISFESESFGQVYGRFSMQADATVSGYMTSDEETKVESLSQKNETICTNILKESGRNADVVYMKRDQLSKLKLEDNQEKIATNDLYKVAKAVLKAFAS